MAAVKLTAFGGMIPAQDETLLPDQMAAAAQNAWLYEGTLQGIREPKSIFTCTIAGAKRVFRVPRTYPDKEYISDSDWLEFQYEDTDVVRSPIANDTYNRFYWTNSVIGPQYNSKLRIQNGSAPLTLGVPYPTTFPGVTASGGVSTISTSRAYLYTWVSQFGEESAPSAPYVVNGKPDDTWTITITPPTSSQQLNRLLEKTRIYRTVTAADGTATYYFVAELPLATTIYTDNNSDTVVSSNDQLTTTNWTPPPSNLSGMVSMPNGMIAGFRDNEIWFCEPYRPHAWPAVYTLSVNSKIVGVGVVGQTLIVCTETYTHAVTGINPANMSQAVISTREPCMSRGSIISTPDGVLYASPNGLCVATPAKVANVTPKLFTKNKWQDLVDLPKTRAAMLGDAYYFFGQGLTSGGMIDPNDPRMAYMPLVSSAATTNVFNDPWTNEVFVMREGVVYQIDLASSRPRSQYVWKSKKFQMPNRRNVGAIKVFFDTPTEAIGQLGTVKIYADGVLRGTKNLTSSGLVMRMPSGFKADYWQFEVTSKVILRSMEAANTVKELSGV